MGTGVIAEKGSDKFTRLDGELWSRLNDVFTQRGSYAERNGPHGVEGDSSFKQIVPFAYFVASDGRFLIYQRNPDPAKYDEARLRGRVSICVGGHARLFESVSDALCREFAEEAEVSMGADTLRFTYGTSAFDKDEMMSILRPRYVGIIDDEKDAVGEVHLGVAIAVSLPQDWRVRMKKGESASFEYAGPSEYQRRKSAGEITPTAGPISCSRNAQEGCAAAGAPVANTQRFVNKLHEKQMRIYLPKQKHLSWYEWKAHPHAS